MLILFLNNTAMTAMTLAHRTDDPGVSVTLVNLKNRVVSTDGSDPSPGGSDSLRTSATKAVIDPSILEELRDWSDKVHKKVTKWLATDSQAKRLYLLNLDQLVLDEAGIAEFAPSQSSDPGGKRRLDEHWQVTDWQLPPSQSHRPNSKGGGRKIHNVKTSEADDEEEEEEEEEKRDPESLGSSIRQSPKGLDKQRAKNPASLLGNGDDRNLLKSTLDTAQEARRLYAVRDDLLNDAMENLVRSNKMMKCCKVLYNTYATDYSRQPSDRPFSLPNYHFLDKLNSVITSHRILE
ncbi:hypothetical protein EV361DRAFT_999876 [Lentinula raphanica]|nr:hypothetical protein EV361DRAFT_999876 [Lentinula raphanica]